MTRAWLTPDSPAPETGRCRTISVPDDVGLVAAVTGALLPLTNAENWEQSGTMTVNEAADIMSAAFELFVESDCEPPECPPPTIGGVRIIRISPSTGRFEELAEDGETWVEPTGEYAVPPIGERAEPTEDERICAAATNAANVMRELYNGTLELWENAVAPLAAFEQFGELAGELANAVLTAVLGAFAPFVGTAWGVFYATMELLTTNTWADSFDNALTCLLIENAVYEDGVVTFNYGGVTAGIFSNQLVTGYDILLLGQVSYLLGIIGADGLNLSGETTAVPGDCSTCGTWRYEFDFSQGTDGWSPMRETPSYYSAYGVYDGTKFISTVGTSPGPGYEHSICVGRSWDETELTGVEVTYSRTNGQFSAQIYAQRIYLNNSDNGVALGTKTPLAISLTPGSAGNNLTYSASGRWPGIRGMTASLVSSYRVGALPNPAGSCSITKIRLTGNGVNPFGADNY